MTFGKAAERYRLIKTGFVRMAGGTFAALCKDSGGKIMTGKRSYLRAAAGRVGARASASPELGGGIWRRVC